MTGAGGTRSGVDAAERGLGLGWTVRGTMSATAKSTKNMIKRMRRASTAASSGRVDSAKTRLFRQKVVRMTLFMLHEGTKVTVVERNANHWKIQLANGNTGWMAAEDLTEV